MNTPAKRPRARAILRFQSNWQEELEGVIRPGGELVIEYAPERLANCRTEDEAGVIWNITAHVRFLPGEQHRSGSVVRDVRKSAKGKIVDVVAEPLVVPVPAGARRVEVWFESQHTVGVGCHAWDSRHGENYCYDVEPARRSRMP